MVSVLTGEQCPTSIGARFPPLRGRNEHVGTGVSRATHARSENEKPLSMAAHHALPVGMDRVPKMPTPERGPDPLCTIMQDGKTEMVSWRRGRGSGCGVDGALRRPWYPIRY
jgi:hypothetical protein